MRSLLLLAFSAVLLPMGAQQPAGGMRPMSLARAADATAGSAADRAFVALSLMSDTRVPFSIRPLSDTELDSIAAMSTRAGFGMASGSARRLELLPQWASLWINTGRSVAAQDGPIWQGRGTTIAGGGGARVKLRHLSLTVRPLFWATENRPFRLAVATPPTLATYANPLLGPDIDAPYRFGDAGIFRLNPGESSVRVGAGPFGAGFTTASQHWGPGWYYPLIMSTESGGYPRVFVEARSANVFVGRVTANWSVGRLESSGFSNLAIGNRSRIVPAIVGTFTPAPFPGLELGATRLFHVRWDRDYVDQVTAMMPFSGLLKASNPESDSRNSNQIASMFFRIAPPKAAAAVYGELARDDHNWDARDLAGEPDHHSAYMLGVQRAIRRNSGEIMLVVIELANGRFSHIARIRGEPPIYTNNSVPEGHTNAGQMLGTTGVATGGGLTVGVHHLGADRTSLFEAQYRPTGQNVEGGTWSGQATGAFALRYERSVRSGKTVITYGAHAERGIGFERPANFGLQASVIR